MGEQSSNTPDTHTHTPKHKFMNRYVPRHFKAKATIAEQRTVKIVQSSVFEYRNM